MEQIHQNKDLNNPLKDLKQVAYYQKSDNLQDLPQEIKPELLKVESYLKENIIGWDAKLDGKIQDYEFSLPPTVFEDNESRSNESLIKFKEQTFEVEQLEVRDLNRNQLSSIRQHGTFIVPSEKFEIPYEWKISDWILLGNENIKNVLFYHMAHCNGHFWKIFSRFYSNSKYTCDMYKGLKATLYKPFKNVYSIIFGKKYLRPVDYYTKINEQRTKFFLDEFENQPETRALQEYYEQFDKNHPKNDKKKIEVKQILGEISRKLTNKNEEYRKKYLQDLPAIEREKYFIKLIEESQNIPKEAKKDIFAILRALYILNSKIVHLKDLMKYCPMEQQHDVYVERGLFLGLDQKDHDRNIKGPQFGACLRKNKFYDSAFRQYKRATTKEIQQKDKLAIEKRENIEKEIRQNYPILGKSPNYKVKLLKKAFEREYDFEIQQMHQQIQKQFREEGLENQLKFYQKYLEFYKKEPELKKQLDRENNEPLYTHHITRSYAHNPKIMTGKDHENKTYYYLQHHEPIPISTNTRFWKLKYMAKQFYIGIFNIADVSFFASKNFFKAIFKTEKFYASKKIDRKTGVLSDDEYSKKTPILVSFKEVWGKIKSDREKFENAPDDKFLKKKFGRTFNLVKNYFFRFLFHGILVHLGIMPALYLSLGVLLLACTVASPALALAYTAISKAFRLVFYDYLNPRNADALAYFPVINTAVQSALGVVQIGWSAFMVAFDIFRIILHILLGIIRYPLLHIYNFFTYNLIIKPLGRVPVGESAMAFRIGGPGVGKTKFFYSLEETEIQLLVRAKMEQLQLENYHKFVEEEIRKPSQKSKTFVQNTLFKPFEFTKGISPQFKKMEQIENALINKLNTQVQARKKLFPYIYDTQKVRFKQDELDKFMAVSEEIVSAFIEKDTPKDKLRLITENIWKQIFRNQDIIKPLEINAWQFNLNKNIADKKKYDRIVKKNLKSNIGSSMSYGSSSDYYQDKVNYGDYAVDGQLDNTESECKYGKYSLLLSQLDQSSSVHTNEHLKFFIKYSELRQKYIKKQEEEQKLQQQQQQQQQ